MKRSKVNSFSNNNLLINTKVQVKDQNSHLLKTTPSSIMKIKNTNRLNIRRDIAIELAVGIVDTLQVLHLPPNRDLTARALLKVRRISFQVAIKKIER
jgi:hypothetical protein